MDELVSEPYPARLAFLTHAIHDRNVRYGFKSEGKPRDPVHICMLIDSEIAEAFEEVRKGYNPDYLYFSCKKCKMDIHTPRSGLEFQETPSGVVYVCPECLEPLKPEGFAVEYADALIRLLDAGPELGINYDYLVPLKMAYNDTRAVKHGKTM